MPRLYFGSRGGVYYLKNGRKHYIRNMEAPGTPPPRPPPGGPPPPPRKAPCATDRIFWRKGQINELIEYMNCMINYIENNVQHIQQPVQGVILTMFNEIKNNLTDTLNNNNINAIDNLKSLTYILELLKQDALTLNAFFRLIINLINDQDPCNHLLTPNVQSLFVQRRKPSSTRKLF